MGTDSIRFNDGAAYERYMGKWSQLAGETFLDWLAPEPGLRWLDVGCGNGAFTEMLVERCAPVSVQGIDPSEEQLAFARTRARVAGRTVSSGRCHGAAVPRRHVRRGGHAAGDLLRSRSGPGRCRNGASGPSGRPRRGLCVGHAGGGFPYDALQAEMRGMGVAVPAPPSPDASRIDAMRDLWKGAGLDAVETREIAVQRTFADFDDYWTTIFVGPSVGPSLAAMASEEIARLKARMRARACRRMPPAVSPMGPGRTR